MGWILFDNLEISARSHGKLKLIVPIFYIHLFEKIMLKCEHHEMTSKVWNNLPLFFDATKYTSKKSERLFQILMANIWTILIQVKKIKAYKF